MSRLPSRLSWRLSDLKRDIDEAFAALIESPWGLSHSGPTGWPETDLYDTDDAYLLLADLPGVAPEDIELHVDDRQLLLCGRRWSTGFFRHGQEILVERSCGRFCRRFSLELPVDIDRIEQGYENGIYWARLPKRSHQESTRGETEQND